MKESPNQLLNLAETPNHLHRTRFVFDEKFVHFLHELYNNKFDCVNN